MEKNASRLQQERADNKRRIGEIVEQGKTIFEGSGLVSEKALTDEDVLKTRRFLKEAARFSPHELLPAWWEHTYAAAAMGREIATKLSEKGTEVDSREVEITLLLHDVGRLVSPQRYFRNDFVQASILKRIGILSKFDHDLVPMTDVLGGPDEHDISKYNTKQLVVNLADNLGKRTKDGTLFKVTDFFEYLDNQDKRYPDPNDAVFATEKYGLSHMREGEEFQRKIVSQTLSWLEAQGIDINQIQEQIKQESPTILYLVRHGDTNNRGLLYNWDEYSKDPVGITDLGKEQMRQIAQVISKRRITISDIYSSDILRAKESAEELVSALALGESLADGVQVVYDQRLRDEHAPAAMKRWVDMDTFRAESGGNVYDNKFSTWEDPNTHDIVKNETLEELKGRHESALRDLLARKSVNGARHLVIMGHGDSIRVIIEGLEHPGDKIDANDYNRLSNSDYLNKGEAWEIIFDPNGDYITKKRLPDPSKSGGRDF